MCGLELLLDGKMEDAKLKFRDAAELGSSSAMYNLGVYYYFWRRTRNVEKVCFLFARDKQMVRKSDAFKVNLSSWQRERVLRKMIVCKSSLD